MLTVNKSEGRIIRGNQLSEEIAQNPDGIKVFIPNSSDYFLLWYDRSTQLWASIMENKVTVIV